MSIPRPPIVYLHGFASGPQSRKAGLFRERFAARGHTVSVPDLNPADFRDLTVGGMLQAVEKALSDVHAPAVLIGSSLGGYLAALCGGRSAGVKALILIAPAFDLRARWVSRLGPDAIQAWRRLGTIAIFHHGKGEEMPLSHRFFEESELYPAIPDVGELPVLVFHGRRDDVIPVETVERFARGKRNVTLRLLDDVHDLVESAPYLLEESARFIDAVAGASSQ